MSLPSPRVTLISALGEAAGPAGEAMRAIWPQAQFNFLIDDSLARDLAAAGELTPHMIGRFMTLGRYAADAGVTPTRGLLFICSAFGPAIDCVKADLEIPVVSPNEGAFEEALDLCRDAKAGGHIGLLLTFEGSATPLAAELEAMAAQRGQAPPSLSVQIAEGALAAVRAGDNVRHDALVADAAARLPRVDVTVLGQFSMAGAAPQVRQRRTEPVLTTPHAAVRKLKALVEAAGF